MMGHFLGGERKTEHGTPAPRASREHGIDLAPLTVRQMSPEERERYMNLPPPPELAAKKRRAAARERRDAEMGVTPEIKAKGLAMLREGNPVKEIAAACHVSDVTVYEWRKQLGAAKDETERVEAMQLQAVGGRIETLIGDGKSPEEIRKQLVVSRSTFDAAVKRLGVEWINDQWENVVPKAPNSSTEGPAPGVPSEPERTSEEPEGEKLGQPAATPITGSDHGDEAEQIKAPREIDLVEGIRRAIAQNDSPRTIMVDLIISRDVVDAYAHSLGYLWDGSAKTWLHIGAGEDPRKDEAPSTLDRMVALIQAIDEGIEANKPPHQIASEEHVSELDAYKRATARGLYFNGSKWVSSWAAEREKATAHPETPQGAEMETVRGVDPLPLRAIEIPGLREALTDAASHSLRDVEEGLLALHNRLCDAETRIAALTPPTVAAVETAPDRAFLVDVLRLADRVAADGEPLPETYETALRVANRAAQALAR